MSKFYIEDIVHAVSMAKKVISINFSANSPEYSKYPEGFTLTNVTFPALEQVAQSIVHGDKTEGIISGTGFGNSNIEEICNTISFNTNSIENFEYA